MSDADERVRLDVWLWRARFFRTRTLAAKAVAGGVRVNGARTDKPSACVRPGDVLTFVDGAGVRVAEVAALGARRGPAAEARSLYVDRTAPDEGHAPVDAAAPDRRPSSRDRRALAALRRSTP
ncbi:MAG: RNA-binding S4 domain-containing protein [Rhodobacteraceae bacterium]|nr:MAG: RNA-binding S4 domain-containing protein [Paracoccaceae bacterium]